MVKRYGLPNMVTNGLFIIYSILIAWILLFKLGVQFSYMDKRSVNLIPFNNSAISNGKIDAETILNIVIMIPLGVYAGVLFKRWTLVNNLLFFFFISLMFEVLQFIFRIGAFDITDILTNTSGGIIGLIIFKAIEKLFNNNVKAQKFINIVAGTVTVVVISLLLLLKLNMLPVRYQ